MICDRLEADDRINTGFFKGNTTSHHNRTRFDLPTRLRGTTNMKLQASLLLLLALLNLRDASAANTGDASTFNPHRISFADLSKLNASFGRESAFLDALSDVGLVSIRDVPGYAALKDRALASLHACVLASSAPATVFADGTRRRSLATRTVPGPGGAQSIFPSGTADPACSTFAEASDALRSVVSDVTEAFGVAVADELELDMGTDGSSASNSPLLSTKDGAYSFDTFADIVKNGEHLEHFHSYQQAESTSLRSNKKGHQDTIDLHVDQGLFIVFTPGMLVDTEAGQLHDSPTTGFYIETKDGTVVEASFHADDIVVMLGDGVDQYVNPGNRSARKLRATPHALSMPDHSEQEARVWHGRMILPPPGALHPKHDTTFDDLRRLTIDASLGANGSEREFLDVGCSSPSNSVRHLQGGEETLCEKDSVFCWHRCMAGADYDISEEICGAQGLELKCINPREQVYIKGHGDYYPACTNSVVNATEYPTLPTFPRTDEICEPQFSAFASSLGTIISPKQSTGDAADGTDTSTAVPSRSSYDHVFDLKTAKFMWSIVDGKVVGRLAYNGIFGYLAIGLAGPPGSKHNGMNDAPIIMALPGGNYTAKYGLDLSLGPQINEHHIHPSGSSFRHWASPLEGRDTSSYSVETTDCFTAISFETDSISDQYFNVTGTDELIWAANSEDFFAGHHGKTDRAKFTINWVTGEGKIAKTPCKPWDAACLEKEKAETGGHDSGETDSHGSEYGSDHGSGETHHDSHGEEDTHSHGHDAEESVSEPSPAAGLRAGITSTVGLLALGMAFA